mgnify:CR=1 FL=1
MSVNVNATTANIRRASAAWGAAMPRWVRLLASACDAGNQRSVGDRLGKSSGYISRLISNTYTGSLEEAERLIRAAYGNEDVVCPLWGSIPLASCMTARRRKQPPTNQQHRLYRAHCPHCPNNSDTGHEPEEN